MAKIDKDTLVRLRNLPGFDGAPAGMRDEVILNILQIVAPDSLFSDYELRSAVGAVLGGRSLQTLYNFAKEEGCYALQLPALYGAWVAEERAKAQTVATAETLRKHYDSQ